MDVVWAVLFICCLWNLSVVGLVEWVTIQEFRGLFTFANLGIFGVKVSTGHTKAGIWRTWKKRGRRVGIIMTER